MEEKRIYTFKSYNWDEPILLKLTKKQGDFVDWLLQETTLDSEYFLEEILEENIPEFEEKE